MKQIISKLLAAMLTFSYSVAVLLHGTTLPLASVYDSSVSFDAESSIATIGGDFSDQSRMVLQADPLIPACVHPALQL